MVQSRSFLFNIDKMDDDFVGESPEAHEINISPIHKKQINYLQK